MRNLDYVSTPKCDSQLSKNSLIPKVLLLSLFAFTACATGRATYSVVSAETSRYSHTMHNRFYEAWRPPNPVDAPQGKTSVPVSVWIDQTGRILRFKILRPSGNQDIDKSILDVSEKIAHVRPPPLAASQQRFDLMIYFELDVKR